MSYYADSKDLSSILTDIVLYYLSTQKTNVSAYRLEPRR